MNSKKPCLTPLDVNRLIKLAPKFDVEIVGPTDDDTISLKVVDPRTGAVRELTLQRDIALSRILAEVCSRTVRWIFFHSGEPASRSLLKNTDARLARIAELYALWKEQGCPS